MRLLRILFALSTAAFISAYHPRTAQIYVQPVIETTSLSSSKDASKPQLLTKIDYDPTSLSNIGEVVGYEYPEFSDATTRLRIGLYDPSAKRWLAGTTLASVENFAKGYAPNFILTVDRHAGEVLSVAVKGVVIDAGHTRDFGPKALILPESRGKQPELNKPVMLSPEGKRAEEEPEKSFLQKYWWMIAVAVVLMMGAGGPQEAPKEG